MIIYKSQLAKEKRQHTGEPTNSIINIDKYIGLTYSYKGNLCILTWLYGEIPFVTKAEMLYKQWTDCHKEQLKKFNLVPDIKSLPSREWYSNLVKLLVVEFIENDLTKFLEG